MTTVGKHEYFKMMRVREERIRTFMQLELEACLEEVSWMLRCYNCEALNRPQEEYPARLFPTPPPSYIDNLQSRLIRARKGIFPGIFKNDLENRVSAVCTASSTQNLSAARWYDRGKSGRGEQHVVKVRSIAATRRGRYGVRETRNAAAVARDQYEVTWSIVSRNANGGRKFLF